MFSFITYTVAFVSIFASMSLTKPSIETLGANKSAVHQVYKVGVMPQTEYYKPIYVDNSITEKQEKTEITSDYIKLLNDS